MEDIFNADDEHSPAREASDWGGPSDPVAQRQPPLMAQLVELQEENARLREDAERFKAIADMWLWETVNERDRHSEARSLTRQAFKESERIAARKEQK